MILTCPECSTNYMAKDGSIGPNGRSVRCARCEAVWYVEGTDPDALALEDNKAVLITEKPETMSESDAPDASNARIKGAAPLSVPAAKGAHTLLRDKADAEKLAKRKRLIRLIWVSPLLILIGVTVAVIVKRQTVVEKYPRTATIFQAIGLEVKSNGLDLRNLANERLLVDGEDVLRVTGDVVNLTSQAKVSPLIQLRLENRSGEPLADWFVEPGTVPAGETVKIETDYPAPPIDGASIHYRFVPED